MKTEQLNINGIPAVRYGEESDRAYLYIHGKGGNKEEASVLAEIATPAGYQVIGIDLPGHGARADEADRNFPWLVVPDFRGVMAELKQEYREVSLYACSIGAYYSLLSFRDETLANALLVSPVLDMKHLIENMMTWAGVTPERLKAEQVIETSFGETLSWEYYEYANAHPLDTWNTKTAVLWAGGDNLTDRATVTAFCDRFGASLTVMEDGEHWFHTPEQMAVLRDFIRKNLKGSTI